MKKGNKQEEEKAGGGVNLLRILPTTPFLTQPAAKHSLQLEEIECWISW